MITLPGIAVQSKIYESSASLVYRGIGDDGRAIVVKMLKQDYPSPQELTRYRQEYEITSSLNLEGVIKAYSQQDYQRTLVILLEDFGGESLEQWMRSHPETFCPMDLLTFLRLAIKLTDILGKIHAAHVIHKDINSGNIVLNLETGVVKIIDFGIATQFSLTNPTFKSPHVLEGTFAYLSPEQTGRMNRSLDYRTDFYSLGVTFYQLVTGQLPFPTTNILELVHCHIAKQPVLPHELNATVPRAISDIVMKLMAKNAEDRYQSAWGIKADLERCAHQLESSDRIDAFQLGLYDVSNQFQIPQKLYGRESEIATLLVAFERVTGGDSELWGQEVEESNNISASSEMMLVSGYAGIGKSALVQELYKPITAKRGYFISGKFDQFQRNIPYSAIADALQKLVRQLLSEPDEQVQQWRSLLQTALGSNGQLIVDVIPEVELIIGKQSPVPEVGATEAQNRFNRVFQQFIRVLCSKDRPLAIFLDDLQWVDSATLKLIELIMLDEQIQFLFLIGAYRDNEVNPTHPLVLMLERLRKQGAVLQEIILSPLTLEPLSQLIAETLHHNTDTVNSLAELVLCKTEGNPFFVNEFLRFLYSENLLSFDAERLSWQWDIAEIQAQDITDNVVELMLIKLKKLPEVTQQILCLAACVGAEFNLETLAIVCEQSLKDISLNLLAAAQAGLIQPLSELDENLLVQEYKFLHDRVQQAAYALIDEAQRQVVHLQIGRNLLEKTAPEQLSERLFEIVDHLNHGIKRVTVPSERDNIAKLNLMAAQKAKGAIAYDTAQNYLAMGRSWLAASSWQTTYDLTLALHLTTTEVAYLCGEFEQVEYWGAIVLQESQTLLDTVKVYEVTIQTNISQNQPLKAINTALQVLQQLEINFPKTPSQSDIRLELDSITALFNEKEVESLIHLPEMTEPDKLAAMRILSSITIAAQISAPHLIPLIAAKQVNLSIQYGNAFVSPFAYATFGLILCGVVGDIETGYQFGQLALKLSSQPLTPALRARTLLIVNNCIIHWKEHARELLEPLLEGYQIGLETGDLESAAYCAYTYCFQSYANGKELLEVERDMMTYGEAIHQIKQETALTWNQIFRQVIINLMGRSISPIQLIGESYNEENELPRYEAANDGSTIFTVYFNKLFLCYLFCEYAQAVENAALAKTYLVRLTGSALEPLYYLYDSLARLAIYLDSSAQMQEEILKKLAVSQKKMKHWAYHAPMNHLHKYHLVEAEKARVLGQLLEAEEFYEQAIQGARENGYIQEEALAYELSAKFYLERGREKIAQTYMKESHYCYARWGATAKVNDLQTRYPQFYTSSSSPAVMPFQTTAGSMANTSQVTFDLAAVLKASQAISREIELGQLLNSLMQILIENAGAQTGYLILENAGEWVIEAACEFNDAGHGYAIRVLQAIPIIHRLPESIIQYVIRTHESVILNDATHEGRFVNDSYIQNHLTQSILCLPLLNQSKLVGVLYLENQLTTGVFTPERSQVLHLLSIQAAIAIENARIYAKLQKSKSQLTQFLEAIPVGVAVVDKLGHPYYFNQRATQLLAKDIDPSLTLDDLTEVYQAYLAGTNQKYPTERMPIIRALTGEHTTVGDIEIHQNNAIIPIEAWGTPVFDEQGNVIYAIAAFQDITERKQAEKLLADYNQTLEQQVNERTLLLTQEIEERQRIENALRQSEEQRRLTMDFTHIGSWNWNILENTTDWNGNHARLLGLVPDEVESSYQAWRDRVHPEDIDRIEQAVTAALTTHTDFEAEYRVIYPDGRVRWLVGRGRGIYNEAGQPVQMLGVILDISDRKQAEEVLRESEAQFREQAILSAFRADVDSVLARSDSLPSMLHRCAQAVVKYFNAAFARIWTLNKDKNVLELQASVGMYPRLDGTYSRVPVGSFKIGRIAQDRCPLLTNNVFDEPSIDKEWAEREGMVAFAGYPILLDEQLVGVIAMFARHPIPLSNFEALEFAAREMALGIKRQQAEVALQASETELRALFSAMPDPLFVINAEGRILRASLIESEKLYKPIDEQVGRTLHEIFERSQADTFLGYIRQALSAQQPLTVEYSLMLGGRETWSAARISPISEDSVIWLARDISDRKRAEKTSILEERNRMAREIHDTLAQAFTGILLHIGAATEQITKNPEMAQAHMETIDELARTGLAEARRSVTTLRPKLLEEGDLYRALNHLTAQMKSSTNTHITCEIIGVVYPLSPDVENNLLRIGQEALTNAIKYAHATVIQVELIYEETQCLLQIQDDGKGFEVDQVYPTKGFGLLGMSERVEQIRGELIIRSQPDRGTEIIVIVNRE